MKLLEELPDGSADLTFVDPPFNIGYEYVKYEDDRDDDDYLGWCMKWMMELHRVTKKHGTCWVHIGDEFVSELDMLAKGLGFHKRAHVIHYYTFGVACSKNFARSHDHLLYYTKTKTKFTFNADDPDLRVPSARQLVYNDKRANPKGKLPDNTWVLSPVDLAKTFTKTEDTWLESRVCGTFGERAERGETGKSKAVPQMPLAVMDRIILACSNPGDLVLDPMMATGTTGVSALRNGRNFWGCDVCGPYVTTAKKRLKAALNP